MRVTLSNREIKIIQSCIEIARKELGGISNETKKLNEKLMKALQKQEDTENE